MEKIDRTLNINSDYQNKTGSTQKAVKTAFSFTIIQ